MNQNPGEYVFLTDCGDLGEARVLMSYLESLGLHPRARDLHTRSIASHLSSALGKLTIEVPAYEFMEASRALEKREVPIQEAPPAEETHLTWTQGLAKKSLNSALIGLVVFPILPNFYSMVLGYRVLKSEKPFTSVSRNRLFWAVVVNSVTFIFWFMYFPQFLRDMIQSYTEILNGL